jgi:DNA polymerase III delta subunit
MVVLAVAHLVPEELQHQGKVLRVVPDLLIAQPIGALAVAVVLVRQARQLLSIKQVTAAREQRGQIVDSLRRLLVPFHLQTLQILILPVAVEVVQMVEQREQVAQAAEAMAQVV